MLTKLRKKFKLKRSKQAIKWENRFYDLKFANVAFFWQQVPPPKKAQQVPQYI